MSQTFGASENNFKVNVDDLHTRKAGCEEADCLAVGQPPLFPSFTIATFPGVDGSSEGATAYAIGENEDIIASIPLGSMDEQWADGFHERVTAAVHAALKLPSLPVLNDNDGHDSDDFLVVVEPSSNDADVDWDANFAAIWAEEEAAVQQDADMAAMLALQEALAIEEQRRDADADADLAMAMALQEEEEQAAAKEKAQAAAARQLGPWGGKGCWSQGTSGAISESTAHLGGDFPALPVNRPLRPGIRTADHHSARTRCQVHAPTPSGADGSRVGGVLSPTTRAMLAAFQDDFSLEELGYRQVQDSLAQRDFLDAAGSGTKAAALRSVETDAQSEEQAMRNGSGRAGGATADALRRMMAASGRRGEANGASAAHVDDGEDGQRTRQYSRKSIRKLVGDMIAAGWRPLPVSACCILLAVGTAFAPNLLERAYILHLKGHCV